METPTPREKSNNNDYIFIWSSFLGGIVIGLILALVRVDLIVRNQRITITTLSGQLSSCEEQNQTLNILLGKKLK